MKRALLALCLLACGEDVEAQAIGGGAVGGGGSGTAAVIDPLIDVDVETLGSGPSNLDGTLVGFTGMSVSVACDAMDISGATLTCDTGGAAPEAGAGTSPTSGLRVALTDTDARGVQFTSGQKYYEASSTSVGDVTTGDLAVEAYFLAAWDGGGSDVIISKRDDGGTNNGWDLAMTDTTLVTMTIDAGAASQSAQCAVTANSWSYVACFVDRNVATGMQCSCNGLLGTATDPTAAAGSLTTTDPLRIGANVTSGTQFGGKLVFARAWSGSGLNALAYDAAADARFSTLLGLHGTAGSPSVVTRNSFAHTDIDRDEDGNRYLFRVGINHPTVAKREYADGFHVGYMRGMGRYNLLLQSEALGTTWALIDAGDTTSANTAMAPDGNTTADNLVCNINASQRVCGVRQSVTTQAAQHTFSAWVDEPAAGDPDFAVLRVNTIANTATWFNVTTCTVATTGSAVIFAYADDGWVDGYCRISIAFTSTAAAHDLDLITATANNDIDFANAGGVVAMRAWGMQIEEEPYSPTPGSYYPSAATQGIRYTDELRFPWTMLPQGSGTTAVGFVCQDRPATTGGNPHFLAYGSSANEFNTTNIEPSTGDVGRANSYSNGTQQWDLSDAAPDLMDGTGHEMRVTFAVNDVDFYVDGTLAGSDTTSVYLPVVDSADYVQVGSSITGTGTPVGCLITRARIWDYLKTP